MHARAEKIRKSKIAARPPKTFLNLFVDKCRRRPPPGEGAVRARARAKYPEIFVRYFFFCVYHLRVTNFETECWIFKLKKNQEKLKNSSQFPAQTTPLPFCSLIWMTTKFTSNANFDPYYGGVVLGGFFSRRIATNLKRSNYSNLSKININYPKSLTFNKIDSLKVSKITTAW